MSKQTTTSNDLNIDIINYAIDGLNDKISEDRTEGNDLHHHLFNMDYFIIGYYAAEQWLIQNVGIFQAIEDIKQYEQDNFGEVSTDLSSSEKVVNMWAYIEGEKVLQESKHLQKCWDKKLSQSDINKIKKDLQNLLK